MTNFYDEFLLTTVIFFAKLTIIYSGFDSMTGKSRWGLLSQRAGCKVEDRQGRAPKAASEKPAERAIE
jgi:hypothetical protein